VLADGEVFATGKYRFRYCQTPHLPHGWDAGVLFDEAHKTLLCSDLFHQTGDVEPLTEPDVVGRSHAAMLQYQGGVLADYVPYTPSTSKNLKRLADLKPKTLGIMHVSSFRGDCARADGSGSSIQRSVWQRERRARERTEKPIGLLNSTSLGAADARDGCVSAAVC
jgi:hypothetical protein